MSHQQTVYRYKEHYILDLCILKQPGQAVPGRTIFLSTEGPAGNSVPEHWGFLSYLPTGGLTALSHLYYLAN